jgi:hypothetical protein
MSHSSVVRRLLEKDFGSNIYIRGLLKDLVVLNLLFLQSLSETVIQSFN